MLRSNLVLIEQDLLPLCELSSGVGLIYNTDFLFLANVFIYYPLLLKFLQKKVLRDDGRVTCEDEFLHAIFPWDKLLYLHLWRLENIELKEVYH